MQKFCFVVRRTLERSVCVAVLGLTGVQAADPWADRVDSYDPGQGAAPGFTDPTVSLGSPERFTGEGVFPSAVTMFSPAFGTDEIVQIARGGSLVVEFDEPIVNDPAHPFGVDLIVFGNGGFIDEQFPNGQITGSAAMFGLDPMRVSVSTDGVLFTLVGDYTEGLFPAQGYRDVSPFSELPGADPTDFTFPIDPSLTQASFAGLSYAQALALYGPSGGGTPIDIAGSGLGSVRFVKIESLDLGQADVSVEIDGFATVPEPGAPLALLVASAILARRRARVHV